MNKFAEMLEELEVLEELCRIAEKEYFDDENNEEKELEFCEASNAEAAAFHRVADAIVEFTSGRIQSHIARRILIHKRKELVAIISCM